MTEIGVTKKEDTAIELEANSGSERGMDRREFMAATGTAAVVVGVTRNPKV